MAPPAKARRSYHHGNLQPALLDAAAALVAERGPEGFSMLDAARACGVSASAPYKHFADKAALLEALAQRALAMLNARLAAAWGDGRPEPGAAFLRVGQAYLAFAREAPGHYLALFRAGAAPAPPPLPDRRPDSPPLGEALAALGIGPGAATEIALQVWAISHGLASLERAGQLALPAEQLLDRGVGRLLRGLAAEAPAEA
ncbi:TetR/AcrR family transcriptional regulator [Roseicella frigidaeris]|uniref:TetR/AcrR family transcriptional regulator n=1 Tax=Roseicella frigidaeris TaxID=2230885 RepID=A0A327MD05_9PROT|nr:TetR/AcrR family transcriptional regulator [Roseicella frigidaeris]RAI60172.1 TetR/AcrR family transcriptional regulator [Roseicella frigidaeris]